jgi:hypothetical protein
MAESLRKLGFDYATLTSETRVTVKQKTTEIRDRVGQAAQGISEVGERLIEVKEMLKHGQFLNWLECEFAWSESTAQRMMSVNLFFKSRTLTDLDLGASTLYMLASASTPEEIKDEFIAKAQAGEAVTHAEVKAAVAAAKPARKPKAKPEPNPDPTPAPPPRVSSYATNTPDPSSNGHSKKETAKKSIFDDDVEEAKEPEIEVVKDGRGQIITDPNIASVFKDAVKFDAIVSQLLQVSKGIKELAGDQKDATGLPAGAQLRSTLQSVRSDFKNLWNAIKWAKPFCLCPYPHSKSKGHVCNACKNLGWVVEATFDNAPSEMREGAV